MKRATDLYGPDRNTDFVLRSDSPLHRKPPDWRVLVVDSHPDVHAAARAALAGQTLFDRPVEFIHASSEDEALALLLREQDVAMVLLEADTPGQDGGQCLLDYIRNSAGLRNTRIVLRTGNQGQAPGLEALLRYDINDHCTSAGLTPERLRMMVVTAVRSYRQLCAIDANRHRLELVVRSSASLLDKTDPKNFATGVLTQLAALLNLNSEDLLCAQRTPETGNHYRVLAATGRFTHFVDMPLSALPEGPARRMLEQALTCERNVDGEGCCLALHIGRKDEQDMVVFIDTPGMHDALDQQLLNLFCVKLSKLLHNRSLLARLQESAYYDPLVRLPNRAHFVEKVNECAQKVTRNHILAILDIDDFSATNDVMGHHFGDRLLDGVARRLTEALPSGVFLARLGSDSFGVLGSTVQVTPQQLLDCVRQPLCIDGVPHKVSLTCGYVMLPDRPQAGADLVKDATIALKRAKRGHRGQHLQYSDHMSAEARSRARLLTDLRAAVDNAQLYLVYQPQRNLQTHALTGLEALLRWRTTDGDMVPPDQFIPVAEHSGLIVSLGQWVLCTACQTMRELLDAGVAPQRMAVNVSAMQLQDPGFFETVRAVLQKTGLRGDHLELEITESVAALPTQLLIATLAALRAEGIAIAIDDFGTGYSSLSYLERLPLDRIKIDRSFIRQLSEPHGARIAEMVTQLGLKLGLQVLAEGIEDDAAWQALLAMDCHEGQGYYIARPMEKTDLIDWIRQQA